MNHNTINALSSVNTNNITDSTTFAISPQINRTQPHLVWNSDLQQQKMLAAGLNSLSGAGNGAGLLAPACSRSISTCVAAAADWWKSVEQVCVGRFRSSWQRQQQQPFCSVPVGCSTANSANMQLLLCTLLVGLPQTLTAGSS